MKTYELTYIVSPEITSEEAESKAKEIETALQGSQATILKQSSPVAKALSYPIKKFASGFVGVIEFQAETEKLPELKVLFDKDRKILRYMLIIKEPAELKKERRTRGVRTNLEPTLGAEQKTETISKEGKSASAKAFGETRGKVELKDIEHELEEILGE